MAAFMPTCWRQNVIQGQIDLFWIDMTAYYKCDNTPDTGLIDLVKNARSLVRPGPKADC